LQRLDRRAANAFEQQAENPRDVPGVVHTAVVRTLPVGARAVAVAGLTYYVASGVYYKPVYEGSEVVYQEVENPEAQ